MYYSKYFIKSFPQHISVEGSVVWKGTGWLLFSVLLIGISHNFRLWYQSKGMERKRAIVK